MKWIFIFVFTEIARSSATTTTDVSLGAATTTLQLSSSTVASVTTSNGGTTQQSNGTKLAEVTVQDPPLVLENTEIVGRRNDLPLNSSDTTVFKNNQADNFSIPETVPTTSTNANESEALASLTEENNANDTAIASNNVAQSLNFAETANQPVDAAADMSVNATNSSVMTGNFLTTANKTGLESGNSSDDTGSSNETISEVSDNSLGTGNREHLVAEIPLQKDSVVREDSPVSLNSAPYHKLEASPAPDSQLNEPDTNMIPEGCNVKNASCVPTRDELIAAGVTNVDFVQHKVDISSVLGKPDDIHRPKGCNVKNASCVPTRDELIAAGVTDVDFVQHKVDISSVLGKPEDIDRPKGCNVKNASCVPTRDELIAAGVTDVDFVQHKVDISTVLGKSEDIDRPKGCNVKNASCVPTRDELIASGVTDVDFVQHKVDISSVLGKPENIDRQITENGVRPVVTTTEGLPPNDASDVTASSTGTNILSSITNTGSSQSMPAAPSEGSTVAVSTKTPTPTPNKPVSLSSAQQIPSPGTTTLKSGAKPTPTAGSPVAERSSLDKGPTPPEPGNSLQAVSSKPIPVTAEIQSTCPKLDCKVTCRHGSEEDSNGCPTCRCKYSQNCPRVLPSSRLLCLLRIRTSLSCETDADCNQNRICCPGTCGRICRRESRSRSMLLSMMAD